jgi:PIN domain nuclease of toxin-antitoxin system
MNEYVTDTHALLWHLYEPSRLGRGAQVSFAEADTGTARIYVPALVIAEVIMVAEKGRIPGVTLARVVPHLEAMRTSDNYPSTPLLPDVVLQSRTLTSVPDIFDRLIVAEAITRRVPLLSRDRVIRASGLVAVVWD